MKDKKIFMAVVVIIALIAGGSWVNANLNSTVSVYYTSSEKLFSTFSLLMFALVDDYDHHIPYVSDECTLESAEAIKAAAIWTCDQYAVSTVRAGTPDPDDGSHVCENGFLRQITCYYNWDEEYTPDPDDGSVGYPLCVPNSAVLCSDPKIIGGDFICEDADKTLCTYGCSDGACNEVGEAPEGYDACFDSDGGLNYYKSGTVSINGNAKSSDKCLGDIQLLESYCSSATASAASTKTTVCDVSCSNGACEEKPADDDGDDGADDDCGPGQILDDGVCRQITAEENCDIIGGLWNAKTSKCDTTPPTPTNTSQIAPPVECDEGEVLDEETNKCVEEDFTIIYIVLGLAVLVVVLLFAGMKKNY